MTLTRSSPPGGVQRMPAESVTLPSGSGAAGGAGGAGAGAGAGGGEAGASVRKLSPFQPLPIGSPTPVTQPLAPLPR